MITIVTALILGKFRIVSGCADTDIGMDMDTDINHIHISLFVLKCVLVRVDETVLIVDLRNAWYLNNIHHFISLKIWCKIIFLL